MPDYHLLRTYDASMVVDSDRCLGRLARTIEIARSLSKHADGFLMVLQPSWYQASRGELHELTASPSASSKQIESHC